MARIKTARRVAVIIVCSLACIGSGCGRVGPLELKLNALKAGYEKSSAAGPLERKAAIGLLKQLVPFLSEKNYTDSADIARRKEIQYQASMLLTRIAHDAGLPKPARAFYMNAYLLKGKRAFRDVSARLAPGTDLKLFRRVHIPNYKVVSRRMSTLDFSTAKDKNLDEKTRAHSRAIIVDTVINEVPAYYLMQMLCGDLLYKLKGEHTDLGALSVNITSRGKLAATGIWDFTSDELLLRLAGK